MRRLGVGRGAAIMVLVAVSLPAAPAPPITADPLRPNFLVIVTDDQRWDTIGRCLGGFDGSDLAAGANSCMPRVQQKLVANGVTFLRGYVTQALCCPSRASILTGQLSTHTGVTGVADFPRFDDDSTLATWLHDTGYRTGMFGKYLNGYGGSGTPLNYVPPGWDAWHGYYGFDATSDNPYTDYTWIDWDAGGTAVQTQRLDTGSTTESACASGNNYSTDLVCYQSLQFLRADATRPFMLYVAPGSPHEPPIPAGRWSSAFQGLQLPTYPNTNVVPSPNPPSYLPRNPLSPGALAASANARRNALATNLAADEMVGALFDELSTDGRLQNTVIFFISDNGIGGSQHRWTTKQCEYEECHRVPFVVVCPPAICPGATPGRVDVQHFALNIDIAPTIAELAGVTPTLAVDGRSLAPILSDPGAAWRTAWLLHDQSTPLDGIVATQGDGHTYKYVEFTQTGERELFDLSADPWELANLADDPAYAGVRAELAAALAGGAGPTVTMLTPAVDELAAGTGIGATWSGSSGIVRYDLFERVGIAGVPALIRSSPDTTFSRTGSPGTTYCYRVDGFDAADAVASGEERCVAVPFDDRSARISYSGSVSAASGNRAFLGTLTLMDAAGERAAISATTRKVGILMRRSGSSGIAHVFVDGSFAAAVDLYSRRTRDAVHVFTTTLPLGPHTVEVAWTGARNPASSGTGLWLDGIALVT